MKKVTAVLAALVLALAIGGTVQAGNHMGGKKGDCGSCIKDGTAVPAEQLRKFQADTIDLRQEMMMKRFEIQRENLKATPDNAKVSTLQAEIKAIQTKISDIRVKSALPDKSMRHGDCGHRGGSGDCGYDQAVGCGGPCGKK
ncbi:MAG: hypothetical protein Q7W05_06165 [Deltaproteobacteria bacterium]|nr:hypothetical protein [Deltaproteobacteria bacterium]